MHSDYGAFICIIVHLQCVAFYMSCIQMHLYASPHKVYSVNTLHSDALAFLRIQAHSDAFTHTYAFTSVRRCIHSCMHTRVSIRMKTWMTCSGTWVLHWHALWQNGTPTARPAHTRPCEFGLQSARLLLCKYVWSLVYSGAF